MSNIILGLNLVIVSSLANGTFAIFLRRRKVYELEHMWGCAFLIGYLVLPIATLSLLVPGWVALLQSIGGALAIVLALGAGWGVASLFFIYGIDSMGMSSGYAIIFGTAIAFGALIPLIRRWPEIGHLPRLLIVTGICVCVVGVVVSSIASGKRNQTSKTDGKMSPAKGIAACIVAGVLSACTNVAYDLSEPVMDAARELGIGTVLASIARWIPTYIGGCAVVALYSFVRITRRRSWSRFAARGSRHDILALIAIGLMLTIGHIPYGVGTILLGKIGITVGWAVFISMSVIVANLIGFVRGEWKGTPRKQSIILAAGVAVLIAGVLTIMWGNSVLVLGSFSFSRKPVDDWGKYLYALPMSRQARGILAAISAFGLWGIIPIFWSNLSHVDSIEAIAHRIWWSFLLIWLLAAWKSKRGPGIRQRLFSDRKALGWAAIAGVLVTTNWLVCVWAISQKRTLDASLGYYINPLINVALGTLVLRERLSRLQWIALLLAVAGVAYLTVRLGTFPWISIVLALSFGMYGLIKKKISVDSTDSLALELSYFVPVALGFILWREFSGNGLFINDTAQTTILLIANGAVTVIPLLLFGYAARSIKLSDVGFIQYMAPTLMLLIGVFALDEPFDPRKLPGFLLVWIGLIVYSVNTIKTIRATQRAKTVNVGERS